MENIEKVEGVRIMRQVIVAPTMRPDGSILQQEGYDAATETFYKPNAAYPEIENAPTRTSCLQHLEALNQVVKDFPFAEEKHRSAWLAGVLTCVGRTGITGPCPMFVVDSNAHGTGKTKLVHAATHVAYGTDAPCLSKPAEEDEARKQITAVLLGGHYAVLLDNVLGVLRGASMAAVLTSASWSDRRAGSSELLQLPSRTVWWATGNNVTMGEDIARRSLLIRLGTKLERPDERADFQRPSLLTWIDRERAQLVASALSILRGYVVADRPSRGPAWGYYESWTSLIPGAIRWLGLADPLAARASIGGCPY